MNALETLEEHRKMVGELVSPVFAIINVPPGILHAILGVATESGELLDAVKKSIFYDQPLDYTNLDEEFGDNQFYTMLYCIERNIDLHELLLMNIRKLRKRYGDKWSQGAALERDLKGEREALETDDLLGEDE